MKVLRVKTTEDIPKAKDVAIPQRSTESGHNNHQIRSACLTRPPMAGGAGLSGCSDVSGVVTFAFLEGGSFGSKSFPEQSSTTSTSAKPPSTTLLLLLLAFALAPPLGAGLADALAAAITASASASSHAAVCTSPAA